MITGNIGALFIFIFTLTFFKDSVSLECYICGDGNLDEDGECHAQFLYDCTNYARNFNPNEPIFCRTIRKRISNGTYTIMKECISEQDHNRVFPPRQYSFDEECDLIEIDGDELAYCICRRSFCNMKNIIDQFIDFEENHPEIFITTNNDDTINDENGERLPVSSQAHQLTPSNYPTIRNTFKNETNNHYGALMLDKHQSNDNSGENNLEHVISHPTPQRQMHDISRLPHQMPIFPSKQNYESGLFTGNIVANNSMEQNEQSVRMNKTDAKFLASKQIATFLEIEQHNVEEKNENYCYSCMENLNDPADDCLNGKIVQCSISKINGRSKMCVTKQSIIAIDKSYKLEKRCSTDIEESEVALNEMSTRKIACMRTLDALQVYCLCLGNYCNKDSLLEQVEKLTQSSNDENHSMINSILNENSRSIISSVSTQYQTAANNNMLIAAISYSTVSLPNLVNSSDAWISIERKNLEKDNIVSSIASCNLSTYHIIIIIALSLLAS